MDILSQCSMEGVMPKKHSKTDVPCVALQVWIIFSFNVLRIFTGNKFLKNVYVVTKWYKLFLECPSGFKNIANDLNGSQEFTELGEADITKCEAACNDRSGCTAFEFNHAGEENYKCGTYTGGVSDILTINTGGNSWSTEGYQKSTWTSCYKGISSTSSYYYHYYHYYYNGLW